MRNFILFIALIFVTHTFAQELNCNVVVNAQQTGNENVQVFKTLERQLSEFINNTSWTKDSFKPQERINCGMVINITDYNNDLFQATIQIQSSRPVFNSTYATPIYNYNDKNFSFQYLEFQNLVFNPNQYESNLVSVLAFHVYMILGMDADSFKLNGGDAYYRQAQTILNYSTQGNFKGWKLEDGTQTRFRLIDNVLSPTFKEFRSVMYEYHFTALDQMGENPKESKSKLSSVIKNLETMNRRRPNSYLMRVFFDAKAEEIQDIFSGGPKVNVTDIISTLTRIAPTHAAKWRSISF
ncbi:DUF4835 domain-containing protein [Flavobacteriales bacterium 34_180_T64]|nr:DUF4835 domain-containing protein [Flavobacteriales bacterium 34_180_T64]